MKIASIESRIEHIRLSRPYTISRRSFEAVDIGILEIRTDKGLLGLGAASPEHTVTGETLESCRSALHADALEWMIGRDPRELISLCRELRTRSPAAPAARAAVDMALHDLFAQCLELPLVEVLGRAHESLPTSITIGIKPLDETVTEAREYIGRGFRAIKIKLSGTFEEDLERLRALRGTVRDNIAIRVDPNQAYNVNDLTRLSSWATRLGVEFVEQPVANADIDMLRTLPAHVRETLAADESLLDAQDALRLLEPPRACGIFNIKLMKCGGILAAQRIANIAEIARVALMWGCMDESVISISAALHAALASPATRYLDLDGSLDLVRDPARGGFILENGVMRPNSAPGLGVRLKSELH